MMKKVILLMVPFLFFVFGVLSQVTINGNSGASTASICLGESISLTGNYAGGSIESVSWTSDPSGFTSTSVVVNPMPLVNTTYYLYVFTTGNVYVGTANITVTVNPLPGVDAGVDKSVCFGSSTNIGSSTQTGYSYDWNPTTGLSDPLISNPIVTPTTTATYTVVMTNLTTGCQDSDDVIVTVNPLPNLYVVSVDGVVTKYGEYCEDVAGSIISIDGSEAGFIYQLQYYIVPNTNVGSSITGTGGAIIFPIVPEDDYMILIENPITFCQNTIK